MWALRGGTILIIPRKFPFSTIKRNIINFHKEKSKIFRVIKKRYTSSSNKHNFFSSFFNKSRGFLFQTMTWKLCIRESFPHCLRFYVANCSEDKTKVCHNVLKKGFSLVIFYLFVVSFHEFANKWFSLVSVMMI